MSGGGVRPVGVGGTAGGASAGAPWPPLADLLDFRHSFLIVFTEMSVALFPAAFAACCACGAGSGCAVSESAENRLVVVLFVVVVFERGRLPGCCWPPNVMSAVSPLPMVTVSHCAPDTCTVGGSGVDECRPNGSGDMGITGESADPLMCLSAVGALYSVSSSSSRLRRSLSESPSGATLWGMYDLGADVETPLSARRGGEAGGPRHPGRVP